MLPAPRHILVLAVAAAFAAGSPMAGAWAQDIRQEPARGEREVPRPRMQDNVGSLSDAVRRVQRETGGRILGAERVPYDGRDINRVKYMDERGRVRYMDDAPPPPRAPRAPRQVEQPPRGDNP
ncbi:hypothetical protein [Stenotrophomonas sp. PS02297]|uniref:hypothetical protein n=1 Tax=Stenotrophomonas sp. PS02297 TaxID=2991423 RepID=UPI002499BBF2|nr:hypothetical protein [Stenotrophomonas sp. PS02297]